MSAKGPWRAAPPKGPLQFQQKSTTGICLGASVPTVMVLSHNRRSRRAGLVELSSPPCGSGHPPVTVKTAEVNFTCPKCSSLYEVVRAEAAPAVDPDITCPICGRPLPAREAQYAAANRSRTELAATATVCLRMSEKRPRPKSSETRALHACLIIRHGAQGRGFANPRDEQKVVFDIAIARWATWQDRPR